MNPIGEVITVWGVCEQGGYKKRQGKPGPNYEPLFIAGKVLSWPRNCYVSATVLLALHPGNTVPSVPMKSISCQLSLRPAGTGNTKVQRHLTEFPSVQQVASS